MRVLGNKEVDLAFDEMMGGQSSNEWQWLNIMDARPMFSIFRINIHTFFLHLDHFFSDDPFQAQVLKHRPCLKVIQNGVKPFINEMAKKSCFHVDL